MPDPTDEELLEFVAMFVGWTDLQWANRYLRSNAPDATLGGWRDGKGMKIPDYLNSLDAFARDVWPKIREDQSLRVKWIWGFDTLDICDLMNADARSRCLALWRALDGKLPEEKT